MNGRHVFIAGLARAGTTILMRSLYDTGLFRSLTYRDMPFVLMPITWSRFSSLLRAHKEEQVRAHGDRIKINFDSPEAFEEVFWMTFCKDDYIKADSLMPHDVDNEHIAERMDLAKYWQAASRWFPRYGEARQAIVTWPR